MTQQSLNQVLMTHGFSEENSLALWKIIEKAYSKATAFYHNLSHIKAMIKSFEQHKAQLQQPDEVLLAIFFHDLVYDIQAADNEAKSAQEARQLLADAQNIDIEAISALILATQKHQAQTNDEAYLVDFDLQILGSSPELYVAYTQKIRKEYRAIPNKIYQPERKAILEAFLQQESIYQTQAFKDLYEQQARENIAAEIATMLENEQKKKF
jgi:predicted metal-dependent HD superfamily phosphohydrolase